jgi:hypothetical protein
MEPPTYFLALPVIGLFVLKIQQWSIFRKRITPSNGHDRAGIVNLGNLSKVSPPRTTANLLICGPCVGRARLKIVEIFLNLTMPLKII